MHTTEKLVKQVIYLIYLSWRVHLFVRYSLRVCRVCVFYTFFVGASKSLETCRVYLLGSHVFHLFCSAKFCLRNSIIV